MTRSDQDAAVHAAARSLRALADEVEKSAALHTVDQAFRLAELIDESDAVRDRLDTARDNAFALCAPGAS